ncbi:hypothetical protein ACEPAI_4899 [Sanghuangporus weigelae]
MNAAEVTLGAMICSDINANTKENTCKHFALVQVPAGILYWSYDDEAALKRHLNRKHKGDGNGAPLADVQVFIDSSSQGSSRPDGRLDTPSLTQGSSGSEDSRGSTAGPSTPTVDIQVTEEAPGSAEDWWFQKLFPDEGTFAPFPSGTERMLENESASTPSQYRDASSFSMAPWPGWDMLMLPHYSSQFFNGSESGV